MISSIGVVLIAAGVLSFMVSFRFEAESRARWRANWWAITLLYVGVTLFLTGRLLTGDKS